MKSKERTECIKVQLIHFFRESSFVRAKNRVSFVREISSILRIHDVFRSFVKFHSSFVFMTCFVRS